MLNQNERQTNNQIKIGEAYDTQGRINKYKKLQTPQLKQPWIVVFPDKDKQGR